MIINVTKKEAKTQKLSDEELDKKIDKLERKSQLNEALYTESKLIVVWDIIKGLFSFIK